MRSGRSPAAAVLLAIYAVLAVSVVALRGSNAEALGSLVLQTIAGLTVLQVLSSKTSDATPEQVDGYYTTAANSLIGFGMILSAFTILRAGSGPSIASEILSIAPTALAATATGLAAGTFFFVLGHIRAASVKDDLLSPPVERDTQMALIEVLQKLTVGLTRQDHRLETMTRSIEQLSGIVSSTEGHSWIETQARLAAPLSQIAAAIPLTTTSLKRCESIFEQINHLAPQLLTAVSSNTEGIASSEKLLQQFHVTGERMLGAATDNTRTLIAAVNEMRAIGHGVEGALGEVGRNVTSGAVELKRAVEAVLQAMEQERQSSADIARTLGESSSATATAFGQHAAEVAACRDAITGSATASTRCATELQTALAGASEAVIQLRTAITADQRGLLTTYLEGLGTSATRIAEDVMKHVPPHLDKLLDGVERRILSNVEKAFERAYTDAEERFKAFNDSVGVTAQRLSTIIGEFDRFNRAFVAFEESVRNGATSAAANATAFTGASSQLVAATRQFTDAVAQNGSPETSPLLTAMRATVDTIAEAARVFSTAQARLAAEQEQMKKYSASLASIRLEAAKLRIKADGTT